jgi:hypothetical protein
MQGLTKQQIIKELCTLSTEVNEKVFEYSVSTDCFCTKDASSDYRFNQEVLEFIKAAVVEKIKKGE